jgi:hypothetical protein
MTGICNEFFISQKKMFSRKENTNDGEKSFPMSLHKIIMIVSQVIALYFNFWVSISLRVHQTVATQSINFTLRAVIFYVRIKLN